MTAKYYEHDYNSSEWVEGLNDSIIRKVIHYLIDAINLYAESTEDELIKYIFKEDYSALIIGNELQLSALLAVGKEYSDFAIKWLIDCFPMHLFNYTGSPKDYLSLTKLVVEKHSKTCSYQTFKKLEEFVVAYHLPKDKIKNIYKLRNDFGHTFYYPYWGHLQKEMLPSFCPDRLNQKNKDLLKVLNRNTSIVVPSFKRNGFSDTQAFTPESPVERRADSLSDDVWLNIIKTPDKNWNQFPHNREYYVESTPYSFSMTLKRVAKTDLERFANLALSIPLDCNSLFVTSLIDTFSESNDNGLYLNHELTEKVLLRFFNISKSIDASICNLVRNRASENWSSKIVEYLCSLPFKRYPESNDLKLDYTYFVYNDPRGLSLYTLMRLIENHDEMRRELSDRIFDISGISDLRIQYACLYPLVYYLDIYTDQVLNFFLSTANQDLRICNIYHLWDYIRLGVMIDEKQYMNILWNLLKYEDRLGEQAAALICAIGIYNSRKDILNQLISSDLSDKQNSAICSQASYSLLIRKELSQYVLLRMVQSDNNINPLIAKEYYIDSFKPDEDNAFLIEVFQYSNNKSFLNVFLHHLSELKSGLSSYVDIVKAIVETYQPNRESYNFIVDNLMKISVKLYDEQSDNPEIISLCLNIWDKLFLENYTQLKSLDKYFDSLELNVS